VKEEERGWGLLKSRRETTEVGRMLRRKQAPPRWLASSSLNSSPCAWIRRLASPRLHASPCRPVLWRRPKAYPKAVVGGQAVSPLPAALAGAAKAGSSCLRHCLRLRAETSM